MRRYLSFVVAGVVASVVTCIVALGGCQERPAPKAEAAPQPEFRPTATIKDIMDAFIDPAADHIWDAVATTVTAKGREEKHPRTDEEWKELRRRAIQLMEGANLLLIPGRRAATPDAKGDPKFELPHDQIEALIDQDRASFTLLAHALYDSAVPVLKAIEAKDKDKLLDAGDGLDTACETCHAKYWYAKR